MISYLEGKIIFKTEKFVILDVNNVGFKIFVSLRVLNKLPQKSQNLNLHTKQDQGTESAKISEASSRYDVKVKLFCHLNVKEKGLVLYGFPSFKELESFETLINLPSIGPKAALEISSLGSVEEIKEALEKEDEKIIKEIFNIGKKKAQIIILELSRKIKKAPAKGNLISEDEAYQVLIKLGFPRTKIKEALIKIPKEIQDTEKRVKEALKILGK